MDMLHFGGGRAGGGGTIIGGDNNNRSRRMAATTSTTVTTARQRRQPRQPRQPRHPMHDDYDTAGGFSDGGGRGRELEQPQRLLLPEEYRAMQHQQQQQQQQQVSAAAAAEEEEDEEEGPDDYDDESSNHRRYDYDYDNDDDFGLLGISGLRYGGGNDSGDDKRRIRRIRRSSESSRIVVGEEATIVDDDDDDKEPDDDNGNVNDPIITFRPQQQQQQQKQQHAQKQQRKQLLRRPPPITLSSTIIIDDEDEEDEVENEHEDEHGAGDGVESTRRPLVVAESSTEHDEDEDYDEEEESRRKMNIGAAQNDNDTSRSSRIASGQQYSREGQPRRQQRKYRIPAVAARHRRPYHHSRGGVQDPPPSTLVVVTAAEEENGSTGPVVVSPFSSPSRSVLNSDNRQEVGGGELLRRDSRERDRSFTDDDESPPISKNSEEDDGREMRLDYSSGDIGGGIGIDSIDSIDINSNGQQQQEQQQQRHYQGNGGEQDDERDNVNINNNDIVGDIDRKGDDYDDDRQFVVGQQDNLALCWRSDPSESLSDWTLQIFNRTTKEFYTYHIHRVVLGVGPRACGYFQDVFQQQQQPSSSYNYNSAATLQNMVTRVPLIARACQFVPTLLDYCYRNPQFDVTRQNAVALCYLADFFKNFPLWRLAADFIEMDLSTNRESIHHYYTEAVYYDQNDFLFLVFATCSVQLPGMACDYENEVEEESRRVETHPERSGERQLDACNYERLLDELSPHHFSRIVVEIESLSTTEADLASMTKMVALYCYLHRGELSLEAFDHFISRITVMDTSSALLFLETSLDYDWTSPTGMNRDDSQESISSLVYFEKKCISCLSDEWEALLAIDQGRITRLMEGLAKRKEHSTILVQWFQKSILRAHKELSSSRTEKQNIEHEHTKLRLEFGSLKEEFDEATNKLQALDRTYTVTKTELKDQIAGWVKKNENTERRYRTIERELDKQRLNWKQEREKWKNEKAELDRQVMIAREELGKVQRKPIAIHQKSDDNYGSNAPNDTFSVELSAYSLVSGFIPSLLTFADESESADSNSGEEEEGNTGENDKGFDSLSVE